MATEELLKGFNPITLAEMDSVKLLDRTDTKFIFHRSLLPHILTSIESNYRVLEIEKVRVNDYETLYFDTANLDLYLRHHSEKLNRYKVRFRKYVSSNLHFFEIKFKNNKSRTVKTRVVRPEIEYTIKDSARKLLLETTKLDPDQLLPALWVNYSRITLVNNNLEERLTIDLNLTFKNDSTEKSYGDLVIAELKQEKASKRSHFFRTMMDCCIRTNSISKYCLGVTQLYPNIKKNNFKPKLLTLNKILHATS